MKANRLVLATALIALTSACGGVQRPAPTPPPSARPVPAPIPPAPPPADWRDVPLTPGDWSYRPEGAISTAVYGSPAGALFLLRCDRTSRTVTLARPGAAQQALAMTVTTATGAKALRASQLPGQVPYLGASLPASDPLLDAMSFSRGRFRVETGGLPSLTLPSWPEIGRVVEDCR